MSRIKAFFTSWPAHWTALAIGVVMHTILLTLDLDPLTTPAWIAQWVQVLIRLSLLWIGVCAAYWLSRQFLSRLRRIADNPTAPYLAVVVHDAVRWIGIAILVAAFMVYG